MRAPRRRRWFDVLRRGGETPHRSVAGLDDAGLWSAHGEVATAIADSSAAAGRVAGVVAKQRSSIDGAAERAGLLATRTGALSMSVARVSEAFERLAVVALNAGLEGARLAEREGKALLLLSEEIRANLARGTEAARELAGVVDEIAAEIGETRRQIDRARSEAGELVQDASRLRASCELAERALAEVTRRIRQATGVDAEAARALMQAAEHARGLISALSTLSTGSAPTSAIADALRPVLAPLRRLIGELGGEPDSDASGDSAFGA